MFSRFPNIGVKEQFALVAKAQEKVNEGGMLRDMYKELHDRAKAAAEAMGLQVPGKMIETDAGWRNLREFVKIDEYAIQMAAKYAR